jgi:hypothetical protein
LVKFAGPHSAARGPAVRALAETSAARAEQWDYRPFARRVRTAGTLFRLVDHARAGNPQHRPEKKKAAHSAAPITGEILVAKGGIEPPTQGFSA